MPKITMVKPWDIQHVANTLYKLYAEQNGFDIRVTVTPKDPPTEENSDVKSI